MRFPEIFTERGPTRAVAMIYRVNKTTGERVVMRNGTDSTSTNTWLGHGTDGVHVFNGYVAA